jgi:subtilisin family serine protease
MNCTTIIKQILTISAATLLSFSIAFAQQPEQALAKHVEDELLVQFVAGVPQNRMNEAIHGQGAQELDEIQAIRVKRIKVPAQALQNVKKALSRNPHVKFVEENFIASGGSVPNDPTYASQWHLPKISAPQGWDISTGSSVVDIAIIDSGVDPNHPDLAGKLLPGYNFLNGTNDTHDVLGHGTAVAGTAAAISNNGIGVSSLAWKNPIMPLVVLDASDYASYSNIASAITYAVDHGVRVINVSIGGTSSSSTLQNAVNYAWSKGALVFASAMNKANSTPNYPAACANAIAVASTDSNDNRSSFSNYGTWITISAPGSYIYTTNNGGGYGAWNGTSFSSPLTAGLAALVLSVNSSLTNQQVRDIILQNADDLGTAGFDQYFGNGRINVIKSLQAAQSYVPQADVTAPDVSFSAPASGATLIGAVTASVTATDNVGVSKVEFYINGSLVGTDVASPFSFYWDTATYANGSYQLESRSYDAAGNVGSTTRTVTVSNSSDTTAPLVAISSPSNGTSVTGLKTLTIKVAATDNISVTRIELYVDGALKSKVTSGSLSWSWNDKSTSSGQHVITAKAFDGAGNQARSSVSVTK